MRVEELLEILAGNFARKRDEQMDSV